jgi:hypothetical protein
MRSIAQIFSPCKILGTFIPLLLLIVAIYVVEPLWSSDRDVSFPTVIATPPQQSETKTQKGHTGDIVVGPALEK